jgi:hypothetical protein
MYYTYDYSRIGINYRRALKLYYEDTVTLKTNEAVSSNKNSNLICDSSFIHFSLIQLIPTIQLRLCQMGI